MCDCDGYLKEGVNSGIRFDLAKVCSEFDPSSDSNICYCGHDKACHQAQPYHRAEFEAWASRNKISLGQIGNGDLTGLVYFNKETKAAWRCWKAARGIKGDV